MMNIACFIIGAIFGVVAVTVIACIAVEHDAEEREKLIRKGDGENE